MCPYKIREKELERQKRKYIRKRIFTTFTIERRSPTIKPRKRGYRFSAEHKRKMALSKMAEKNPQWKGDQLKSFSGKHSWIRRRLPKPDLCQMCQTVPPFDLANITGKYLRDLNDWHWLCRKCHMSGDGRLQRFRHFGLNPSIRKAKPI